MESNLGSLRDDPDRADGESRVSLRRDNTFAVSVCDCHAFLNLGRGATLPHITALSQLVHIRNSIRHDAVKRLALFPTYTDAELKNHHLPTPSVVGDTPEDEE